MLACRSRITVPVLFAAVCGWCAAEVRPAWADGPLAAQAVTRFSFEEESGDAQDSATAGQVKDVGQTVNQSARVASPFWNQSGRRALQIDSNRQQYVRVDNNADISSPKGVTVSLFCVNLNDNSDAGYRGLFGKRGQQDGRDTTHYGVNYQLSSGLYQVYINDGAGYRVARYNAREALPSRRLLHITATYTVGDAPAPDADTDVDDVRIQYYINGQPLTPSFIDRGFVQGTEAWAQDVNLAGLINNLPFTLGSSFPGGEFFHGVMDEVLIFDRGLNADEVNQLFLELAGADVRAQIARDAAPVPVPQPRLVSVSPPAVVVGQPTVIELRGEQLVEPSQVFSAIPDLQLVTRPSAAGANGQSLQVEIRPAPETPAGIYPLWVRTPNGVSQPVSIVIDRLPVFAQAQLANQPPLAGPASVYGTLSGEEQIRLPFRGAKNQPFVADLSLKRLGGMANPVLELRSSTGAPVAVAWGHHAWGGDVRLETRLPADGIYTLELHDLTFAAPASPYHVKFGDIKLLDAALPLALPVLDAAASANASRTLRPIGSGFTGQEPLAGQLVSLPELGRQLWRFPGSDAPAGASALPMSDGTRELAGPTDIVDATFADGQSLAISDVIQKSGERRRYRLRVQPRSALRLTLQSASLRSPLEGQLQLFVPQQPSPVANSADQPTGTDPVVDYAVPANVSELEVQVSELIVTKGRGYYRLLIEAGSNSGFTVATDKSTLTLAPGGWTLVDLRVTRNGYNGPLQLRSVGTVALEFSPATIPANKQGRHWTRVRRVAGSPGAGDRPLVRILAEADLGARRLAKPVQITAPGTTPLTQETLAIGETTLAPTITLEAESFPVLYRGASQAVPLSLKFAAADQAPQWPTRLGLETTEVPRRQDPNNPNSPLLPVVAAAGGQILPAGSTSGALTIDVPLDLPATMLDLVVKAESVPHEYSDAVSGTAYAAPFTVEVKAAAAPTVDAGSLRVPALKEHVIQGTLQRTPGFTQSVMATITGLPAGYQVTPATVAGDQDAFSIKVTFPDIDREYAVPNLKLRVTAGERLLAPEQPLAVTHLPPQK